jgi:N6-L-threonylcarbamoyladenine synthase
LKKYILPYFFTFLFILLTKIKLASPAFYTRLEEMIKKLKILAIETSCDETAISILEADGGFENPSFSVLANIVHSQIDVHKEYGGVYPTLAKREHAKNLPLILEQAFQEAGISGDSLTLTEDKKLKIGEILIREPEMLKVLTDTLEKLPKPDFDYIAITTGPGLEPALWVGIAFAKALNAAWGIPLVPVNHMEGHILSVLISDKDKNETKESGKYPALATKVEFPVLSLLISGGHTELVLMKDWLTYETIGQTLDDAIGEAFDKVGRILGLEYPGGPKISALAEKAKDPIILNSVQDLNQKKTLNQVQGDKVSITLPRPMLHSKDYNFSFSGIKTAALYLSKKLDMTDDSIRASFAKEFETAVTEVLLKKTLKAMSEYGVETLIIAGGVSANKYIRNKFKEKLPEDSTLLLPKHELATDNSLMIGIAGYFQALAGNKKTASEIVADGNWKLG